MSTRKCPHGHFLVFEMREGKREHQNVPTRAHSGVRDVGTCSAGGGHLGLVVGGRCGASARFPWRGTCWGCWGSSRNQ